MLICCLFFEFPSGRRNPMVIHRTPKSGRMIYYLCGPTSHPSEVLSGRFGSPRAEASGSPPCWRRTADRFWNQAAGSLWNQNMAASLRTPSEKFRQNRRIDPVSEVIRMVHPVPGHGIKTFSADDFAPDGRHVRERYRFCR